MCYHMIKAWQPRPEYKNELPKEIKFSRPRSEYKYQEIKVACGQCIGCRLKYSRDWATRIALEAAKTPGRNWFLTLTYSDENLPIKESINTETGELVYGATLLPKDLQDFLKRLRRHWDYHYKENKIKFYGCGEYGELYERPHYHVCLMNMTIREETLEKWFINHEYNQIWKSEEIEKIWGKGIVGVGEVTWSSAAYVARYMIKKQKGPNAKWFYDSQAKEPEFVRMSRNPGLAREYAEKQLEEIYKNDEIILPGKKAKKVKPPRYFDNLYDLKNPEKMAIIKERRREAAEENLKNKLSRTQLDEIDYMKVEENKQTEKAKQLRRQLREE